MATASTAVSTTTAPSTTSTDAPTDAPATAPTTTPTDVPTLLSRAVDYINGLNYLVQKYEGSQTNLKKLNNIDTYLKDLVRATKYSENIAGVACTGIMIYSFTHELQYTLTCTIMYLAIMSPIFVRLLMRDDRLKEIKNILQYEMSVTNANASSISVQIAAHMNNGADHNKAFKDIPVQAKAFKTQFLHEFLRTSTPMFLADAKARFSQYICAIPSVTTAVGPHAWRIELMQMRIEDFRKAMAEIQRDVFSTFSICDELMLSKKSA